MLLRGKNTVDLRLFAWRKDISARATPYFHGGGRILVDSRNALAARASGDRGREEEHSEYINTRICAPVI